MLIEVARGGMSSLIKGPRIILASVVRFSLSMQQMIKKKNEVYAFPSSVSVSPRQSLPRITLKGIFQDAKVARGPDWEWGNQDGKDLSAEFLRGNRSTLGMR